MSEEADDLRILADQLVAAASNVAWQGRAASAMRESVRRRASSLRRTAQRFDDASQALRHHAAEVDRLKELIAELERRAARLVAAARDRLTELGQRILDGLPAAAPSAVDQLLDRFIPPPTGHLAWLEVDLPGLAGGDDARFGRGLGR
jgi:ABC-type transporter Mla subunit MlaD